MTLLGIIGTIVFVAVVVLSLLAVVDVLFSTSGKRKISKNCAGAGKPDGRRRWLRK
jgi:hypothetical protein